MRESPTWTDVEHDKTDITVVLSVAEALALKAVLPDLLHHLDEGSARNPTDRDRRRQAHEALTMLAARLQESLRPFDVPAAAVAP